LQALSPSQHGWSFEPQALQIPDAQTNPLPHLLSGSWQQKLFFSPQMQFFEHIVAFGLFGSVQHSSPNWQDGSWPIQHCKPSTPQSRPMTISLRQLSGLNFWAKGRLQPDKTAVMENDKMK
jgi:hypothetical protein